MIAKWLLVLALIKLLLILMALAFLQVLIVVEAKANEYTGVRVMKVVDGDTFQAKVQLWPNIYWEGLVRIAGVDAPESITPKCYEEFTAAAKAKEALKDILLSDVLLSNVKPDKYSGRVIADVFAIGRGEVSALLLEQNVVVPYDGGKRRDWCSGGQGEKK